MAHTSKLEQLSNLQREVDRICAGAGVFRDIRETMPDYRAYTPAPPDVRLRPTARTATPAERGPFGRWLTQQDGDTDAMRMLVAAAKSDPRFPHTGDPEAVRRHLRDNMAEGDLFAAIDDAELDWLSF